MKEHTILRSVGVLGVVILYYIFSLDGMTIHPLIIALTAIIALVSPEVLDQLPWGPSK